VAAAAVTAPRQPRRLRTSLWTIYPVSQAS
jgi:hypothetical protein